MLFPGNKGIIIDCLVTEVSRELSPLPGGYELGEKVYWTLGSQAFPDGRKVVHGQQGEVVGPGNRADDKPSVAVLFSRNKDSIDCLITDVSREPPPPLVVPPTLR